MPSRTTDCRFLFGEEHAREIFAIYASLRPAAEERAMEALYSRCCGLEVHKSSLTACVLLEQSHKRGKQIRRFGCTMRELRELVTWLQELGVEHVAMESTGVYWKPVWNVLEGKFHIVLATHNTSRQFRDARQTRRIASGSPSFCNTDCCAAATSHPLSFVTRGI